VIAVKERLIEPEFSRTVETYAVGDEGLEVGFEANATERAALARRLGVLALDRLVAAARLRRASDGRIRAKVTFDADVLQSCVVTMEPVASGLSDAFEVSFGDNEAEAGLEVDVAIDEEDPPEPIRDDGRMELGELVTQHLALALDPYPRKPGAGLAAPVERERPAEPAANPFAALAKLTAKRRP
jgi:uncharacterized metal-binding protein YceD (DUF177 family)